MLQEIRCSTIVSFKIDLKYDDARANKSEVVSVGDLVDVDFNYNGCRRMIQGRVIKIYAEGTDPKKWYMIVDSAEAFCSDTYKFSPMNILDITIIKKHDATQYIFSTNDYTNIKGMRVVQGQPQYTQDGVNWLPFFIDPRYIIEEDTAAPGTGTGTYGGGPVPPVYSRPPVNPDCIIRDE